MPRNEFESNSLMNWIRSPFRKIAELARDDGKIRTERSPGEMVVGFLTFPFRLLFAIAVFLIQAWTTSRNGFAFIRGIPAITIIAAAAGIVWAGWFSDWLGRKLVSQADRNYRLYVSKDPDNPEYAEMFAEKLVQMKPDEERWKYQLALARARSDDLIGAKNIMDSLAPIEDQNGDGGLDAGEDLDGNGIISLGNPDAHVWLGNYYYSENKTPQLTEAERFARARKHYDLALMSDPNNIAALLQTSAILQRQGDIDGAIEYLRRLADSELRNLFQLRAIPTLIALLQEQDKEEEARVRLEKTIFNVERLAYKYADVYDLWLVLVRCAMMLEDYDQAGDIIKDGYQFAKDENTRSRLQRLSASVATAKADQFTNMDDPDQFRERLFALCDAISKNPRSQEVYERLVEYASPANDPENKAIWLRDAILGCPNPAVVHVILGMQEIADGNFLQGQKHWRIANQQFRLASLVVNQMISASFMRGNEVFANTGDMITAAIDLFPEQSLLYYTKGRYLKESGNYEEAMVPLQEAIDKMEVFIPARLDMVETLRELGREEEALDVERKLQKLISELDENDRQDIRTYLNQRERQKEEMKEKKSDF